MSHIVELSSPRLDARAGGKALGLRWLSDHGYCVPPTWVVLPPFPESGGAPDVPVEGTRYAVRSSANVEDGGAISYAGQFTSVLDVTGTKGIEQAIREILASASAEGVIAYRDHQGDHREIEMAVIVQEMVEPVVSGVAFSKNPITGLSEVVVEAVEGSGDRLQAEGITPQRWVHRWGDIIDEPTSPFVEPAVIASIIEDVTSIADAYGSPVDAEWVFDGTDVWWVQVREITGIDEVTIYSRRIAKEVLPGMIKPLVWSINVPMVNRAWLDILEEAVGELGIEAEDLAASFGYRAYFNMSAFGDVFEALGMPRESLELLLGLPAGTDQPRFKPSPTTMRKTPRILGMGVRRIGYGRRVDAEVPRLDETYRAYAAKDHAGMTDEELLADIEQLRTIGAEAASLNVVTPLLANVYAGLLRRQYEGTGGDPADALVAEADHDLDPNPHLDDLARMVADLDDATRSAIEVEGYAALPDGLRTAFDDFFDRFGHFSDSGNDFSVPPWSETPDTVVRMVAARTPPERVDAERASVSVPRWKALGIRYLRRKSVAYAGRRDAVSSMYTFGYGLFRPYVLELGSRLTDRGALASRDDVMYLTVEELAESVRSGTDRREVVDVRRTEMADLEDIDLPDLVYGDDFVPAHVPDDATVWSGTPTARGHHRGHARIVSGIADFDKVSAGDVIVIPFSDVGWTPLFDKAGAVVAESGGMLSHSSIVAREYGLPCVVSVTGAMRIPDGAMVAVDGYQGTVTLEEET
jgi:phosphohistidine swiveling domain-containing protein